MVVRKSLMLSKVLVQTLCTLSILVSGDFAWRAPCDNVLIWVRNQLMSRNTLLNQLEASIDCIASNSLTEDDSEAIGKQVDRKLTKLVINLV